MRWILIALPILFVVVGGFLLAPSPITSAAWEAPKPQPMKGVLAPNEQLRQADLLGQGQLVGPEDTTVDREGVVYAGTQRGFILKIHPDDRVELWVDTQGRPLGMVFDRAGNLIVADSWRGLLSIPPSGEIRVLSNEAEGQPFYFTDDVDIGPDGSIYFTDASSRFRQPDYMLDLLEMRPHGRLLKYDPATRKTTVLARDLYFPNGVAVSPRGDYVLFNETWKYRILKYWLAGPRKGTIEVFADNLPGFPDNLAKDDEGRYWVAFPTLRNAQVDSLHRSPWLKDLMAKLPDFVKPVPQRYGLAIAFNADGQPLASLHDTQGERLHEITSVNPHGGYLYFGSLSNDRVGRLAISDIPGLD